MNKQVEEILKEFDRLVANDWQMLADDYLVDVNEREWLNYKFLSLAQAARKEGYEEALSDNAAADKVLLCKQMCDHARLEMKDTCLRAVKECLMECPTHDHYEKGCFDCNEAMSCDVNLSQAYKAIQSLPPQPREGGEKLIPLS